MDYEADFALARELADAMETASAEAEEQVTAMLKALELAELFSDVPGELLFFGEDLRRASVILDTQLDLLEGFELDLDVLADALRVDRNLLELQLAALDELGLGDAGLLPLLGWDGFEVTPSDLRDVFVGLPPEGEDPELDAAIARLNEWLLPLLLEDEAPQLRLSEQQEADLRLLGTALGADLVTIVVTKQRWSSSDKEYRSYEDEVTVVAAGGQHLLDWLFTAFQEDRGLQRLGQDPHLNEIIRALNGGIGDDEAADLVERFGPLRPLLTGILLGRIPIPDDPAIRALLVDFAAEFGIDASTAEQAVRELQRRRPLQEIVVIGDPTQGEVIFNERFIEGQIAFAIRNGAISEQDFSQAAFIADYVISLAAGGQTDGLSPDGEPIDIDPSLLAQAIFAQVPVGFFTEDQFYAAIAYIRGAKTLGEQRERLAHVVLAFNSANRAGVATFTHSQWKYGIVGAKVFGKLEKKFGPGFEISSDNRIFRFVARSIGVPGYHKLKVRSRVRLHLVVDGEGRVDDFVYEKKPGGFGKFIVGAVLTVVAVGVSIFASPAAGAPFFAVASLYNSKTAFDAGDELGGITALLGAFASFAQVAGYANLANTARAAQAGIQSYRAFDNGDIIEGIGYSLIAIGIGTDFDTVTNVGNIGVGVDNVVEGIEDDNLLQVVDGAFQTAAGAVAVVDDVFVDSTPRPGQIELNPLSTLDRIQTSIEDLRLVAVPTVGAIEAFADGEIIEGVANSLAAASAGANAFANSDGYLSKAFDISTGTRIELADFAAFSEASSLIVDGLDAIVDDDYFRLLARLGEAATIIINDPTAASAQTAEQLQRIGAILDLLANVDPATDDPSVFGQLLGAELSALIQSFEPPPDPSAVDTSAEAALLNDEALLITAQEEAALLAQEAEVIEALNGDNRITVEELPPPPGTGNGAESFPNGPGPEQEIEPPIESLAGVYDTVIGAAGDEIAGLIPTEPGVTAKYTLDPSGSLIKIDDLQPGQDGDGFTGPKATVTFTRGEDNSVTAVFDAGAGVQSTNAGGSTIGGQVGGSFSIKVTPPPGEQFERFPDILDPTDDFAFEVGTKVEIQSSTDITGRGGGRVFGIRSPFAGAGIDAGISGSFTFPESITIERTADAIVITETHGRGSQAAAQLGAGAEILGLFDVNIAGSITDAEVSSVSVISVIDPDQFDAGQYLNRITGLEDPDGVTSTTTGNNLGVSGEFSGRIGPEALNAEFKIKVDYQLSGQDVTVIHGANGPEQVEFASRGDLSGVTISGSARPDGSDATFNVVVDGIEIPFTAEDLAELSLPPRPGVGRSAVYGIDRLETALGGTDLTEADRLEWDARFNSVVRDFGRIRDDALAAGVEFPSIFDGPAFSPNRPLVSNP